MKNATSVQSTRKATAEDFVVGTTLIDSDGNTFVIYEQYGEGMYNARTVRGHVVVFSGNARFYSVAI